MGKKKTYKTNIPSHELEAIARCLLPDIQAYFESEDGKREFATWKTRQKNCANWEKERGISNVRIQL